MIRNDIVNDFIKSVYEVLSNKICLGCYMSPDKTKVMRIQNIKHGTSELRHFIYSKEDISLSNFLFRVDVYVNNEGDDEIAHYVKWASIIEIWNENWIEISQDTFNEFRDKLKEKYNKYNESQNIL